MPNEKKADWIEQKTKLIDDKDISFGDLVKEADKAVEEGGSLVISGTGEGHSHWAIQQKTVVEGMPAAGEMVPQKEASSKR